MGRHPQKTIYEVGHLRAWAMDHLPCAEPAYYPVKSSAHAKRLIDALADSQLLDPNVTENAFGLERLGSDGVWEDWEDDAGANITDDECVASETDGRRQ